MARQVNPESPRTHAIRVNGYGEVPPDSHRWLQQVRYAGQPEDHLHTSAPLADAKTVPIGPAGGKRNHPIYRRSPPGVLRRLFCCCVFQISCLFNYPRQPIASAGRKHRGAIVGTVSFSEAVSHDVRMVRRTLRPAHTGWLENLAIVDITPNPKGNLSDAQHPNRCDDLSHHYWTDCRRMFSNRQRSDGQQALHRTRFQLLFGWEEAERAAPETKTPPLSMRVTP
jgi:hypothetical protein